MLLYSVEHGANAFSDAGEYRLYNVHKLEEKLEDALSALHVSGSTESYIHEETALSQSSISCWAMEYHNQQPPNTCVKAAQGCSCLLHPFRPRKLLLLLLPFLHGQASRVCSLQPFCNPESSLKFWW